MGRGGRGGGGGWQVKEVGQLFKDKGRELRVLIPITDVKFHLDQPEPMMKCDSPASYGNSCNPLSVKCQQ